MSNVKKILYIRSGPYEINSSDYNLQEVGLGKAFCDEGYDFDIVYYTKGNNREQIIDVPKNHLRIFWRKGIKLLRSGIYPEVYDKKFLEQYNVVIVSEYSQIMSVILSDRFSNTYLYNGPYYNLFKIPFVEPVYDFLFCKKLNKNIRKFFCKTEMAKDFIAKKGITNSSVVGVGLDTAKFDTEKEIKPETKALLKKMSDHRNFLYIGSISKRKNVELIIKAFVKLKQKDNTDDIQMVIVGKGSKKYTDFCRSLLPEEQSKSVIWCEFIENAQTQFLYKSADVFLLPSVQEIFGMVLLETMYFQTPAISSHSAGAGTLIKSGDNGIIIDNFDEQNWADQMYDLINDKQKVKILGRNASETVNNEFTWEKIAKKMIKDINLS